MFSKSDRLICFHLQCWVSAQHFQEYTCQSKHDLFIYSWSLIVYACFTSRYWATEYFRTSLQPDRPVYHLCFSLELKDHEIGLCTAPRLIRQQTFILIIMCRLSWERNAAREMLQFIKIEICTLLSFGTYHITRFAWCKFCVICSLVFPKSCCWFVCTLSNCAVVIFHPFFIEVMGVQVKRFRS